MYCILTRTLILGIAVLSLVGCGKGFSSRTSSQSTDTLRIALGSNITTLDPGKVQDIDYIDLLGNVFEGLVRYDENNKIVGQLAEKWDVKDGGKTYVFHLKNAQFHNGAKLTADDVKWTFERNLAEAFGSPTAPNYLDDIVGASEVVHGKSETLSGITVVDPTTLEIHLVAPKPYFLGKLTYPCAFILSKVSGKNPITSKEQAIGTGPFAFSTIQPGQEIDLVANGNYYLGKPKVAKIARPIILDAATRLNQFKSGSLDMLTIQRQDLPSIQKDPVLSKQLQILQRPAVYYFALQEKNYPPFKNEKVRLAFLMAIDRNNIATNLLGGYPPAGGFVAPGVLGYRPDYKGVAYDPTKAKTLLAEAGFPGGKGLPPLELSFRAQSVDSARASEGAAIDLEKNLGIKVSLRDYEWGALLDKRNKNQLQMFFQSWYADYLDPQNFLSMLVTSQSRMNHDGFADRLFDDLCARADVEQDEAKRIQLYQQAEDRLMSVAERIPIYYQTDPILVSSRVSGIKFNALGSLPLTNVSVH